MSKKSKKSGVAEQVGDPAAGTPRKLKRKEYEAELRVLQGELVAMQEWVKAAGAKIIIVFEGRDTAGKGGTIKRITERVSPRTFRSSRCPRRPTGRSRRCTYSGTWHTSPRLARSSSSTAAGTTAPGWSP